MSDIYYAPSIIAGLGNRLFQIASIYGLSRKHGCKFIIDPKFIKESPHSKADYSRFYREYISYSNIEWDREDESSNAPAKYLSQQCLKTNTLFYGFFQSAKYFQDYRSDILRMFSPNEDEIEYINRKFRPEGAAFIHVRLGDYVTNAAFYINLENYYKEAISLMKIIGVTRFLVVSNDPELCLTKYPMLIGDEFDHVGEIKDAPSSSSSELITLFLMKMCSAGGICPNSSFSWWGGWLNENPEKIITLPNKWFNTDQIFDDIYYDDAVVISV
jgi:hypothetical protein